MPRTARSTSHPFIVSLLLILAVSLSYGTEIVGAAPFDDVPAGHWTYATLEQLSAVGLIDGYPPGFFSGSRRLTRYEMALSLVDALQRLTTAAKIQFQEIDQITMRELISAYNGSGVGRPVTTAEGDLLGAALHEFVPELDMLGYKQPSVDRPRMSADGWVLDSSLTDVARTMMQGSSASLNDWTATMGTGQLVRTPGEAGGTSSPAFPPRREGGPFRSTPIASIGGTVFYVEQRVVADAEDRTGTGLNTSQALDGSIHLSDHPIVRQPRADYAAGLGPWPVRETRADMSEVALADRVSLSGERTQRASALDDIVSTQVNAQVLLGDFSIDGKLRSVKPKGDTESPFELQEEDREDLIGLGLTVRLGDVFLSTGQDVVRRTREEDSEVVKSLTLQYSFMDAAATVTAGWQSVSDTKERTSVDVNVPVPLGAVHFGLSYEGDREEPGPAISMTTLAMAGLDLRLWDNAEARAAFSVRDMGLETERETSLGLRYALNPEAAVLLGYKFIDFAEPDERENVTTAEFSIRF